MTSALALDYDLRRQQGGRGELGRRIYEYDVMAVVVVA